MAAKRIPERALTELEKTVLGVVWLHEPCSAYTVRRDFLDSTSAYWSGSAGAIYPVLARLEALGLVRATEHPWGQRTKKEYAVSPRGRRELEEWIRPPLETWTASPTFDPVRTRIVFLELLEPAERRKFVDEAERNLREKITEAKRLRPQREATMSRFDYYSFIGTIFELEGRLRWLRWVRRAIART
ncbi:MAG: PadR family transcriptional regulator [Thermoanaerobaculia bacterium]